MFDEVIQKVIDGLEGVAKVAVWVAQAKATSKEGKDLMKQEWSVCDPTDSMCVVSVMWEKDIGKMYENESYKLIGKRSL